MGGEAAHAVVHVLGRHTFRTRFPAGTAINTVTRRRTVYRSEFSFLQCLSFRFEPVFLDMDFCLPIDTLAAATSRCAGVTHTVACRFVIPAVWMPGQRHTIPGSDL